MSSTTYEFYPSTTIKKLNSKQLHFTSSPLLYFEDLREQHPRYFRITLCGLALCFFLSLHFIGDKILLPQDPPFPGTPFGDDLKINSFFTIFAFSSPPPKKGCIHTGSGKKYVTDDTGSTCLRTQKTSYGCCNSSYSIQPCHPSYCNNTKGCCNIWEFCVGCCMNRYPTSNVQNNLESSQNFYNCQHTCRTSSRSVNRSNIYTSTWKYCYSHTDSQHVDNGMDADQEQILLIQEEERNIVDAQVKRNKEKAAARWEKIESKAATEEKLLRDEIKKQQLESARVASPDKDKDKDKDKESVSTQDYSKAVQGSQKQEEKGAADNEHKGLDRKMFNNNFQDEQFVSNTEFMGQAKLQKLETEPTGAASKKACNWIQVLYDFTEYYTHLG